MPDPLYPLRFEPIFKTVMWGGYALRPFLGATPSPEPTGEAWMLSDHGEHQSRIANGPLTGTTLRQLMESRQQELLGNAPAANGRFPLLLKFLDARENLSVQVHPDDERARQLESGGFGKTEAWVILKAEPGGRIYAGLREGVGRAQFHDALKSGLLPDVLHSYEPQVGDCIFLEAGTVHAIGAGLMLFEIQQSSDITYRLYDWGRVDAKTGRPRQLHIEHAVACTNYERGPCNPITLRRAERTEQLVRCPYFTLKRAFAEESIIVGVRNECRIVVCASGEATLEHGDRRETLRQGSVCLLPASLGECRIIPNSAMTILECGLGMP